MNTLWKGQLARNDCLVKYQPFELIEDEQGEVKLIERKGLEIRVVSPHEINAETLLNALADAQRKLLFGK